MPAEPRAFAVLAYLVQNADRLIGKDELIEKIWDGRFVSDAAVSTVVKTARRSIGDDGTAQKYIKTVHGRGFRFVGSLSMRTEVAAATAAEPEPAPRPPPDAVGDGPTVAVLPFSMSGDQDGYAAMSDAIPGELISILSRLRWLKVIARGSSFRFRGPEPDIGGIGATLGAKYIVTGNVELFAPSLAITAELADSRTGQVIWGDRLAGKLDDVHRLREELVILVTAAMELQIPQHEASLARLRSPDALDAWGAYHVGLQHVYRFNRNDNERAAGHFERAVQLDPNFARAHSALSFTSFQSAFLRYSTDRDRDVRDARRFAERSMELDPIDPFVNFNVGRTHWLVGDPEAGQAWLERATALSPSYAQGLYAHSWVEVMGGRGQVALGNSTKAVTLSPLDPMLYAMQMARALAHMHNGEMDEAAHWADQGARQPGAHFILWALAAAILEVANRHETAIYWMKRAKTQRADLSQEIFFSSLPFGGDLARSQMQTALVALDIR